MDYMKHVDNFQLTQQVPSLLLLGDPALCPAPQVSIMIPTFRRPDLLKIALDSALGQQNPGVCYEVVVVDNDFQEQPSPTQQLMEGYQADNLLYYQNQQNLGIAGNWNRCATLARGQWVAYLHDDDILLPTFLSRMMDLLRKRPNAGGLMVLPYDFQDGEGLEQARKAVTGSLRGRVFDRLSRGKLMRLTRRDSHMLLSNPYGAPTCGSMFLREALLREGGFNQDYHPSFDWFFLYRFSENHKLYRTMERLGFYRTFANESLKVETKAAFIRDRLSFARFAAETDPFSRRMRGFFQNEQNHQILTQDYTDYEGKKVEDFVDPGEAQPRGLRRPLYRLLTRGYWKGKNWWSLIFGSSR